MCPIINKEDWHESGGFEKPHCYALINKNIEVRFDSTSGGAFSALADEIYKKSGYVGGAIYNEDWSVSQFLSSSREDLSRLRSSKYLQSHLDGFYIAVREALKSEATEGQQIMYDFVDMVGTFEIPEKINVLSPDGQDEVVANYRNYIQQVATGEITASEAADKTYADAEKIFAK